MTRKYLTGIDLGGQKAVNAGTGTDASDLVTKAQVEAAAQADWTYHLNHDHQRIWDAFERADSSGTLGFTTVHEREWQGDAGWNITNEYAHRTSGYDVAYIDPHQAYGAWEVEAGPGCDSAEWWSVVRYTSGTSSYMRIGRTGTENLYVVQKIDAGGLGTFDFSVAKNTPWPVPAVGDIVRVLNHPDDGMDVYINDVLIWTGGDTMNADVARCGIAANGSTATIARVSFLPV